MHSYLHQASFIGNNAEFETPLGVRKLPVSSVGAIESAVPFILMHIK